MASRLIARVEFPIASVQGTEIFLSYNRADDASVRRVREVLQAHGLKTFVDWNDLSVGLSWPEKLERALREARAVAVFVGPSGLGPWQTREMYFALDLQAAIADDKRFPVIPVLLSGSEPPTGFLALNTWVDLRDGISEASLVPLIRVLDGAKIERPVLDICPYRDLRAFREEDAALFFGRDETIEKLVKRVDASSRTNSDSAFVAVVGPSGSGKSSVVMAGVIPALKRRRPPEVVWDYVSFTPGDMPWRRFADALVPLLSPELTEAARLQEAATLADALRHEHAIGSAVGRILQKRRGTDRLLMVIDQFEELFTLASEPVAREFVWALLAAARSVPMTLLITLRSDYYGKAIALNRDLSDTLPAAQVNLGPIRRGELRNAIQKPAMIVGLSFEPGLVDRILDDVGAEPGNLPLLEYALTELWKARSGSQLTFTAYDRIGRVAAALANRADALYKELNERQRAALRRLMMRLIRVSAADEEGADTRRRARRSEIDDEAWTLVSLFTSPHARLLVASTDVSSGEGTVEVAHEALIRKWGMLRTWLHEDRRFLLWRQQLAVYRTAWVESAKVDEGTLLRGALLAEAQEWMRTRRGELSGHEREYIEASAKTVARIRLALMAAATAVLAVLIAAGAWAPYQRTNGAIARNILSKSPERHAATHGTTAQKKRNFATLIRLGRLSQLEGSIDGLVSEDRPSAYASLAAAIVHVHPNASVDELIYVAQSQARVARRNVEVAAILLQAGRKPDAIALLQEAAPADSLEVLQLAQAWTAAGEQDRARAVLLHYASITSQTDLDTLASYAEALARHGERDRSVKLARIVLESRRSSMSDRMLAYLVTVEELTGLPVLTRQDREDRWSAHLHDYRENRLLQSLLKQKRFREAEALIYSHGYIPPLVMATTFARAGDPDTAMRIALSYRDTHYIEKGEFPIALAAVVISMAKAGRSEDARRAYDIALREAGIIEAGGNEKTRDEVRLALVQALTAQHLVYDAWELAKQIEIDEYQGDAYFAILGEIVAQRE